MNKDNLLSYGYFFKELPPVFNSIDMGRIKPTFTFENMNNGSSYKCIEFSIPKGQYSRRLLKLPHPYCFIKIAEHICNPTNWAILKEHFKTSTFSKSKVIENKSVGKQIFAKDNRAIKSEYETSDIKNTTILESYDMLYELKLDISEYYSSIYTHSLVWALLGKEKAKSLWKLKRKEKEADSSFVTYDFADKLDILIRECQESQSVGIPIGPDTSHIISEIIGCYVDNQIKENFSKINAFRYFDDYYIYADTEEEIQKVLKFIYQTLDSLQLKINESKLAIRRFPFDFQDFWVKEINSIKLKNSEVNSFSLKEYFSAIFGLVEKSPNISSTIFIYSLRVFEKKIVTLDKNTWPIFESYLLKSILVEPSILEISSRLFETYRSLLSIEKIKKTLTKVLSLHSDFNHHYEIVWSLWIFKQLNIEVPNELVSKIIKIGDSFSILLLLDLNNMKLVESEITEELKQSIIDAIEVDQSTNWLLYFEAVEVKKWLKATKRKEYEKLTKSGLSFYDSKAQIKPF